MKKRIISCLLVLTLVVGVFPISALAAGTALPFSDVDASDWYYDAVAYVYENDLMQGVSATRFAPQGSLTRAMFVTILGRLDGVTEAAYPGSSFSDVPTGQWYSAYVQWAAETEIVTGYGNGQFGPTDPVTREQMAVILYRYAQLKGYDTTVSGSLSAFSDAAKVSAYALDAMKWAVGSNLISGTENGTLTPQDYATRAQIASVFRQYCQNVVPSFGNTETSSANPSSSSSSGNGDSSDHEPSDQKTYTVTFDSNGGSAVPTQTVKSGSMAVAPADPTKEGYTFDGWYCDPALEKPYDFHTNVTADITLYAKWTMTGEDNQLFISPEAYISVPDEENIVVDAETGIEFVNNELIVHAEIGANRGAVISLLNDFGGKVIGELSATDTYQVQFTSSYTVAEIKKLQSEIEASSLISWTSIDLVFYEESSYYPVSDTEWANDWYDTIPSGLNWGVEAIRAPEAWDYRESMSYVRVGIYDNVFYDHNDLVWSYRYFNHPDNCESGHGTHVAGTIAAGFDNGTGITGVAPYVDLYGFSYGSSIALEGTHPLVLSEMALGFLLHNDQCKVLNCSSGLICNNGEASSLNVAKGNDEVREAVEVGSEELGRYLNRLLELGDDFIICVSAGNENNKSYTTEDGVKTSGNINAFYNSFYTAITDPEVKSRIIVVGACKNDGDGTYTYSSFSNVGSRVDVVAPGENIYSTVSNNGYESYPGTSMAAPHVSGIAAMLYAIDPTIKGDRVKEIILETATTDVDGCSYKMVNAAEAVSKAYTESRLTLTGKVADKISGEPISNATVTVKDQSGQTVKQTVSGEDGKFSIIGIDVDFSSNDIFWGPYSVEVEKEGYSTIIILSRGSAVIIDNVYDLGTIELNETTPAISGIVKDADTDMPLEGVTVYFNCIFGAGGEDIAARYETAADGTFEFTIPDGVTALASLRFEKEGYEEYTLPLTASVDSSTNVGTVRLTPISINPVIPSEISGIVKDASTQLPLEDVDVYGYDENGYGPLFTAKTGSDGAFSITLEESGTYSLKFMKEGYEDYISNNIIVASGTTLIGTILLTPAVSSDDIIYISTPEQFDAIRNNLEGHYALLNDIDLSSYVSWDPIGDDVNRFSGILDGKGYKITGLTILKDVLDHDTKIGLFNTVEGTIQNVNITDVNISVDSGYGMGDATVADSGYTNWGVVTGFLADGGVIEGCSVSGSITVKYTGCINAGGLTGNCAGVIRECTNNCDINFSLVLYNTTWVCIGGITGFYGYGSDAKCVNCTNNGNIYLSAYLGGRSAQYYFGWGITSWITLEGIGCIVSENCKNNGQVSKNVWY